MTSVSPFRLLVALTFILGGAILASQLPQSGQQFIVVVATGAIALFTVLQDPPAPPLPDPAMLERQRKRILYQGRSEAYQDIIDPITDPILLVRNATILLAKTCALPFAIPPPQIVSPIPMRNIAANLFCWSEWAALSNDGSCAFTHCKMV